MYLHPLEAHQIGSADLRITCLITTGRGLQKEILKKILPTQNKKATRAFHFPNSFSVSWIWLASISQSYRENLMRVFLLLLSFFFFLILLPRLCFASFSFLSFCFFSRLLCTARCTADNVFCQGCSTIVFSLFFCQHRCLLIRQPELLRTRIDSRWGIVWASLLLLLLVSYFFLLFLFFLPFQPTKAKEWR